MKTSYLGNDPSRIAFGGGLLVRIRQEGLAHHRGRHDQAGNALVLELTIRILDRAIAMGGCDFVMEMATEIPGRPLLRRWFLCENFVGLLGQLP